VDARSGLKRAAEVPWAAVCLFIAVAFGLAWLIALPLWILESGTPTYDLLSMSLPPIMMFCPAIATLVVILGLRVPRGARRRFVGIWPLPSPQRMAAFTIIAACAPAVLVFTTIGVSAAFGWMTLDLRDFSGFKATLNAPLDESLVVPILVMQIVIIPLAAVLNAIPAFGEEVGWRGWLLSVLQPLGVGPAILISGVLWGLWHAPLTLLGHNLDEPNLTGIVFTTVGFTAWGAVFAWLVIRSGSLWPAALGHGSLDASGGLVFMFADAASPMDLKLVNPVGVSGWIVLAVALLVLVVSGQFKESQQR